jgi:hypothetical protein
MKGTYTVLMAKLEEKTPLGMSRPRSEDNTEADLQEIGRERGMV